MERKPKRRTRERILEASLRLFNDFGEHNVSTTTIADELDISPGNLYYHFHSKDELLEELFGQFEREITITLGAPAGGRSTVEDIWLFLHLLFELIWKYRFLYRDLADLLSRNRLLETHLRAILAHKGRTAAALCDGLVSNGEMQATTAEIQTLAVNMVVLSTFWLSFEYARDPRGKIEGAGFTRGAYQVMALVAPYLRGQAREHFEALSREYLKR
ncbi:TetR/AcrR family transcriptional regulator [Niveibacterium umoris]|uniref:AcrR family transcriptional regulator n=1 Tax=Niveibacterium umoris TaxID=1193620 RepID=A0A840BGA1_9RHOO|nr:TetR/AcrR family transcriptional regulator [Niveibacterium umoris]MBB4012205.1 AcrR family transcriptional regulator [Niveibacterium umoris]